MFRGLVKIDKVRFDAEIFQIHPKSFRLKHQLFLFIAGNYVDDGGDVGDVGLAVMVHVGYGFGGWSIHFCSCAGIYTCHHVDDGHDVGDVGLAVRVHVTVKA